MSSKKQFVKCVRFGVKKVSEEIKRRLMVTN